MGLMSSSISFFFLFFFIYFLFIFFFFIYVDLQHYFCGRYFEVYPEMPDNGELLSDATLLSNFWQFINFAISCFVIACSTDLGYTHSYRFMMLIEPKIPTLYFWHVQLLGRLYIWRSTFKAKLQYWSLKFTLCAQLVPQVLNLSCIGPFTNFC